MNGCSRATAPTRSIASGQKPAAEVAQTCRYIRRSPATRPLITGGGKTSGIFVGSRLYISHAIPLVERESGAVDSWPPGLCKIGSFPTGSILASFFATGRQAPWHEQIWGFRIKRKCCFSWRTGFAGILSRTLKPFAPLSPKSANI